MNATYTLPIWVKGNYRHIQDSKIFVQPVESGTRPTPATNSHRSSGFVSQQFRTGIKHPVEQCTERPVRTGIIYRRTNDDTICFLQCFSDLIIKGILKYTMSQLCTLITSNTPLHRFYPKLDYLRLYTFFFKCPRYFRKGDKRIPFPVRTSIY